MTKEETTEKIITKGELLVEKGYEFLDMMVEFNSFSQDNKELCREMVGEGSPCREREF